MVTRMKGRKSPDKKERATDKIEESSGRNALILCWRGVMGLCAWSLLYCQYEPCIHTLTPYNHTACVTIPYVLVKVHADYCSACTLARGQEYSQYIRLAVRKQFFPPAINSSTWTSSPSSLADPTGRNRPVKGEQPVWSGSSARKKPVTIASVRQLDQHQQAGSSIGGDSMPNPLRRWTPPLL